MARRLAVFTLSTMGKFTRFSTNKTKHNASNCQYVTQYTVTHKTYAHLRSFGVRIAYCGAKLLLFFELTKFFV